MKVYIFANFSFPSRNWWREFRFPFLLSKLSKKSRDFCFSSREEAGEYGSLFLLSNVEKLFFKSLFLFSIRLVASRQWPDSPAYSSAYSSDHIHCYQTWWYDLQFLQRCCTCKIFIVFNSIVHFTWEALQCIVQCIVSHWLASHCIIALYYCIVLLHCTVRCNIHKHCAVQCNGNMTFKKKTLTRQWSERGCLMKPDPATTMTPRCQTCSEWIPKLQPSSRSVSKNWRRPCIKRCQT